MPQLEVDLAIKYFSNCLINPPVIPGTRKADDYLAEIGYEFSSGLRDLDTVSEIVGETLGAELVKVIIGLCINTVTQENEQCSKRDLRDLAKALEKVYENKDKLIKFWPYKLNMERSAVGAARNLNYLISAGKKNVTLQSEMNVNKLFAEYRYKCVSEFSPARLQELLFDEIIGLTGFKPVT